MSKYDFFLADTADLVAQIPADFSFICENLRPSAAAFFKSASLCEKKLTLFILLHT